MNALKNGKVIIFSAPSGAGKTTIVKNILASEFKLQFSVSATSRPKRGQEIEGKDYYFISSDEFKLRIDNNEFLEWEEVYKGCYYGTLKNEIERIFESGNNVIFDVDVVGGLSIKKIFAEQALAIFVMPPSIEELENRLRNRNTETEETLKKRIEKANYELTFSEKFDTIIVNNSLVQAVNEAKKVIVDFLFT